LSPVTGKASYSIAGYRPDYAGGTEDADAMILRVGDVHIPVGVRR